MMEKHVREEMRNIARNQPVFAGDTISHATANECVKRGWAKRDDNGDFVAVPGAPFTVITAEQSHD